MKLHLLVGPPGSGKSTYALSLKNTIHISQDEWGKNIHLEMFNKAIAEKQDICVDRMNFDKEQRNRYLFVAKKHGYQTEIVVFHESKETCLLRCKQREHHPTITDEYEASKAINFFFSKYERVVDDEADVVVRYWPKEHKPNAIICDLDGTLCNIDHRLHFVKGENKNWNSFFKHMIYDTPNNWCIDILSGLALKGYHIVYCSGRPDNYIKETKDWLDKQTTVKFNHLFMRPRNDHRQDSIIKEIILDYEILTRYTPYVIIDDRSQVVDVWRKRGYTTLQCAEGNF